MAGIATPRYKARARRDAENARAAIGRGVSDLLAVYSLTVPNPVFVALVSAVRRAHRAGKPTPIATTREALSRAAGYVKKLQRNEVSPLRRPGAAQALRDTLADALDGLPQVVTLVSRGAADPASLLSRLRKGTAAPADLDVLAAALSATSSKRTGRTTKPVTRIVRAATCAWGAAGRTDRYTQDPCSSEVRGPLPDFVRALIGLAGLDSLSDAALQQQLQSTKNA